MPQNDVFENLCKRIDILENKLAEVSFTLAKLMDRPKVDDSKIQKPTSAKEFLLSKKAKTSVLNTLFLCYFLEKQMAFASFNVLDLEEAFRQARVQLPKNLHDMINKNIMKGFLMEASVPKDGKKAWIVTATGEGFVEGGVNE